jgi:hypothetical protein
MDFSFSRFGRIILSSVLILLSAFAGLNGAGVIILTSDRQLNDLMDPDKKIDLSLGNEKRFASLREVCEQARKDKETTLIIAFDEFFRQYREQAGTERRLTPDMDEYIEKIRKISDFAAGYKLGIELSLLSPLELGPAYQRNTGESGRWLEYKVGYRDPSTGKFSLQMWQQLYWTNNKGKFQVKMKNVRAFAFRENRVGNSPFRAVDPEEIHEIKGVKFEALDTIRITSGGDLLDRQSASTKGDYFQCRNLRVYYDGDEQLTGYNRVFAVIDYETSEMDYFSPQAPVFLKSLLKKYHDKGINLVSLYSDEMHIQQDWHYFIHHDNGQFNLRYLTGNFSDAYYKKYGQKLDDKYLLYFVYGAPDYGAGAKDVRNVQYVMGPGAEDIHRTFLLRDRYYKMLNGGVVDLFRDAKAYAETLFGRSLQATGHSSWAESPTIDLWDTEKLHDWAAKYEYTSNYVWGNTIHQAAAACYDYFRWGEYLEPTGNDFAECGWLDRDYYGAAMAASIGVVNKYPQAYAAAWGMPDRAAAWKESINSAFGARNGSFANSITGGVHRDIEVLILYPMNLVAVEERFGSWMTQYAYANYITGEKLMELGKLTRDGHIQVGEKKYSTLVTLFEPLPASGMLQFMKNFALQGGSVVWCGCPPLLDGAGKNCSLEWEELFGVNYHYDSYLGEMAAGKKISFVSSFGSVPEQTVLTDFVVDHIYPVVPDQKAEVVARSGNEILGTAMQAGSGKVYFFGLRPRDDQSCSLGYETRTLFEILDRCGAYKPTAKFPANDNPTYVSRSTDYLATSFPNGSNMIVKHYRTHAENWEGGFSRNQAKDEKALAINPMPSDSVVLDNFKVNGHSVTFSGKQSLIFRVDSLKNLVAFEGHSCTGIMLDGVLYEFAAKPMKSIIFFRKDDDPKSYAVSLTGEGVVTLPMPEGVRKIRITSPDNKKEVPCRLTNGRAEFSVTPEISGKKLVIEIKDKI